MLEFLSKHIPEAIAFASVVLTPLISRWLRLKAKLQYSVGHASSMLVEEPLFDNEGNKLRDVQVVHSASISVKNGGLIPAKAAEVTFNWKPPIFNVVPARAFTTAAQALNRFSLHFDSLAPGEQVSINIMSINQDLPLMTAVRAENSMGEQITMASMRVMPQWFNVSVLVLMVLGIGVTAYWTATGIERVAEATRPVPAGAATAPAPKPLPSTQ